MKLLMVVSFAGMFNLYVVLTVLPLYVVELGGTAFHAGLLAGVGLWTAVALRLVFGPMTDERGRRLPLIIGTAAFALAPLGFWLAPSVSALIGIRALQAIGPAAFLGAVSALAVDFSPPELRATGLGLIGIFKSLGAAVGPPVAMVLADAFGFPAVFFTCTVVGFAGVVCSWLLRDDSGERAAQRTGDEMDVGYNSTAGPAWLRPWFEVLATSPARFATLTVAVVATCQGAIVTFVPLFGESLNVAYHSWYFAVLSAFGMLGGIVAGALSDRFGRLRTLVPTLFFFGAGVVVLAGFASPTMAVVSAVMAGAGFTGNLVILGSMMSENAPARRTGVVFHLQEGAVDVGMGIGSFVYGLAAEPFGFALSFIGVGAVTMAWGVIVLARSARR